MDLKSLNFITQILIQFIFQKKNWDILVDKKCVDDKLGQGKNDYEDGEIIFGLFIGAKIKYCIVLHKSGELEEKITFKGYNKEI